ncbi:topoisomerase 1 [Niveomyces insectorum RCEF 264]|uniref:DNA topoisomerase I n=1 Tax=Niveomyces insectorum RCEF 264 TaxID=1081102 RepID=A0A167MTK6_9HYPO|nr:topoisomerase 1 [Niveomyces insectorum RCEF 264]
MAMDRDSSGLQMAPPGVSIRHGPVNGDYQPNGIAKRKSRSSIDTGISYKDDSDSDDGAPLAKRQKSKYVESDSEDEPIVSRKKAKLPLSINETPLIKTNGDKKPLDVRLSNKKAKIEHEASKEAKAILASEASRQKKSPANNAASAVRRPLPQDDSEDEALAKPKKRRSNGVTPSSSKKANGVKIKDDSDSDVPMAKKKTASTPKAPAKSAKQGGTSNGVASTARKAAGSKAAKKAESAEPGEDDEDDEEYRWWDQPKKEDDSIKWTTLEHNGVVFPPPYQPLPKHVRLYYDGVPLDLHPEAEEVATFFGSMLHLTVNTENPTFQKNFLADFQDVLRKTGGAKGPNGEKVAIKEFSKLDFKPMFEHYKALSEARKNRSKEEKKAEKEEKAKLEAPYLYCKWDGRKEKVGNFRVEPPGLFRGRGEHPKTGRVKKRVMPEQVTINIGKDAPVPQPPAGHKWKAIQHDNKATWLAMWQENINSCYKYVMLAANSAVKGQADHKKFEKARELKKHIHRIRADYTRELKSEVMADRQRATAMYLIDRFALRAGNEKDTDNEADTVGCCSLKYEHITLREPNTVIFDFLGKDSIPYYDEVTVDRQVFKNLKMFKKPPKEDGDDIFDRLNTSQLNKHLSSYMQGLTAKVFRTYNASYTMSKLLQELPVTSLSIAEKVKLYNDCNRKVAILCNHKRTVGASHEAQMEKMSDRIKGLKYQKWRTKMMMLDIDPKQKKKKGAEYFEREADLTDEWILEHQAFLAEELRTKITKKFEKDNEKRASEGERPMPEKELKERLKAVNELQAKFKKENRSKKVEAEGKSPAVEKLESAVQKIDERIHNMELQAADKDGNKEVALSTSKINYIDPRLTVVFSKKFDVPIEKFFSKTLREKFNWAIHSVGDDSTWEF